MTISSTLLLGGAQTWLNNSAGLLTVSGKIANGGNLLTTAGSGTDKISGVLSGAGGLTVSGGSVSLTAAATYSGSTSVTSGTLNLGVANAFGSTPGINIGPGATLLTGVSNATGVSAAGPIVVSGQFIKGAAAGLQESLFRPVILSGGTMSTADPGVSGDATTVYNGSTYYYAFSTGNATNSYVISTSANSGTSVIGIPAGNSLALRNAAGGAGAVQADQPFFTSGAGSTLDVVATLVDWNSASTIGDGINISGSGTVVFSPPAGHPNVYGRNTDIISGTLQVGNTGAIPSGSIGEPYASNVELDAGATPAGTLDLAGYSISVNGLQGSIRAPSATSGQCLPASGMATLTDLTLSGPTTYSGILANGGGVLALAVNGTSSLTLAASNSYSGGTKITAGTLALGSAPRPLAAATSRSIPGVFSMSPLTPAATTSAALRLPPAALHAGHGCQRHRLTCPMPRSFSTPAAH